MPDFETFLADFAGSSAPAGRAEQRTAATPAASTECLERATIASWEGSARARERSPAAHSSPTGEERLASGRAPWLKDGPVPCVILARDSSEESFASARRHQHDRGAPSRPSLGGTGRARNPRRAGRAE